jgi:predicted DNA-binding transcriptional regulator AlpA
MSDQLKVVASKLKSPPRKSGMTSAGTIPTVLTSVAEMPDEALVAQPVVEGLAGSSAATIWRRVKSGLLPQPIRIGRTTRWRLGEVRKALQG